MQQVNLPKIQKQQKPKKKAPPPPSKPIPPQDNSAPPVDPWGSVDPWGVPPQSSSADTLTPQQRVEMIERVYEETLSRKPDTRDINYYKYSTLGEEEIRKQLITGKEHKQLLTDGRDYKKTKSRAEQAETRIKMLEGQIKDQVVEFRQLTELLQEKNRYINELRGQNSNPYNLTQPEKHGEIIKDQHYGQVSRQTQLSPQQRPQSPPTQPPVAQRQPPQTQANFSAPGVPPVPPKRNKTFMDRVKDVLSV